MRITISSKEVVKEKSNQSDIFMCQTSKRLIIDEIHIPRGSIIGSDEKSLFAIMDRNIYYVKVDGRIKPAIHVIRFYDNADPEYLMVYDCFLANKIIHDYGYEKRGCLNLRVEKTPRKELTPYEESIRETKRLMKIHGKPHNRMGNSWNGWE